MLIGSGVERRPLGGQIRAALHCALRRAWRKKGSSGHTVKAWKEQTTAEAVQ